MVATNATIDSFVQNSMAFNILWPAISWQYPASCDSPDQCSPPGDAERFKVLLEKFRSAIESENVLPADKMIISSKAGYEKFRIYKANGETSAPSTATLSSITSSAPLQDPAATTSNETIFFEANSTKISVVPKQASDLKVEIWAPVVAVVFLLIIIILMIWRVKRANAKVTQNSVRSDRKPRNLNVDDTDYEKYGNNVKRRESNYSQLYTA